MGGTDLDAVAELCGGTIMSFTPDEKELLIIGQRLGHHPHVAVTRYHLVPLAAAVVDRRGGMLIHGAIIAREMGIPCVNGIARALEQLRDGDLVTVDGHLGLVAVGPPEFGRELA